MSYLVFAVDGADRLTLLCPPTPEEPRALKQIALSFIQAPKLGKRQATGELGLDEPCAFDAMEFIRSQCLGKPVRFEEDFEIEPIQRTSGRLTLPDGKDAAEQLLAKGLAKTGLTIQPRMPKPLHEKYLSLMNGAKTAKLGVFAPNAAQQVRTVRIMNASEADAILKRLQGNDNKGEEKVRVERVLSASTIIISIGSQNVQAPLALAGIVAPVAPAIAADGKFHIERFLLHRNISVKFTGVDHYFNLVGSVVSPKGCFQSELVARGLVTINQNTLAQAEPFTASLREAVVEAQTKRLGVWADFTEGKLEVTTSTSGTSATTATLVPAGGAGADGTTEVAIAGEREYQALVLQAVTADTLLLKNLNSGVVVKASLSGLRTSKNVQRDHDGKTPETRVTYREYAWEAKEHIRTSFVGKKVSVIVDYARTILETKEVRPMVTCVEEASRTNLAASIIEQGYGTFFLGKSDLCSQAELLRSAEGSAAQRKLGLHSDRAAPETKVVELSRLGESKGKYYLSFLQRGMHQGRPPVLRGIVDVVLGGGALRVYIPKEHFQIPFKVAGIIAPQGALNPGDVADPFATEAKEFAMTHLLQREVDLQVDTADRAGNFIGNIALVGAAKTFAVTLAEAGFASVANADRLSYVHQLYDAERKAKDAKLGIWGNGGGIPQRHARLEAAIAAAAPDALVAVNSDAQPVTLVEVSDSTTVFVQANTPAARELRASLQQALLELSTSPAYTPKKKNELVCAFFREDGSWNRAKVVTVYPNDTYVDVLFIDFGTQQEVKLKDIRAIPKDDSALLRDTPPQAIQCKLASLKNRDAEGEYSDTAYNLIFEFAGEEASLWAKAAYSSAKGTYYGLYKNEQCVQSVNEVLLEAGVVTLDKSTKAMWPSAYARCEKAQEVARRTHTRLWKFGDADEDSDQD